MTSIATCLPLDGRRASTMTSRTSTRARVTTLPPLCKAVGTTAASRKDAQTRRTRWSSQARSERVFAPTWSRACNGNRLECPLIHCPRQPSGYGPIESRFGYPWSQVCGREARWRCGEPCLPHRWQRRRRAPRLLLGARMVPVRPRQRGRSHSASSGQESLLPSASMCRAGLINVGAVSLGVAEGSRGHLKVTATAARSKQRATDEHVIGHGLMDMVRTASAVCGCGLRGVHHVTTFIM